jgi:hypothetical protein
MNNLTLTAFSAMKSESSMMWTSSALRSVCQNYNNNISYILNFACVRKTRNDKKFWLESLMGRAHLVHTCCIDNIKLDQRKSCENVECPIFCFSDDIDDDDILFP